MKKMVYGCDRKKNTHPLAEERVIIAMRIGSNSCRYTQRVLRRNPYSLNDISESSDSYNFAVSYITF